MQIHKGNINHTLPVFLNDSLHASLALVYIDLDQYQATKFAIQAVKDRINKGGVVAFAGINNPNSPGVSKAIRDSHLSHLPIHSSSHVPYCGYIIL